MKVAFDVFGALTKEDGSPHHAAIRLYHAFEELGADLYLVSDHTRNVTESIKNKLGLNGKVAFKYSNECIFDLLIDNQICMSDALGIPTTCFTINNG